jgi:hypothetical protein
MKTLTLLQDYANSSDNIWLAKQLEILEWEIGQKETAVVFKPVNMRYVGRDKYFLTTGKHYLITNEDQGLFELTDDEGEVINQYKDKFELI